MGKICNIHKKITSTLIVEIDTAKNVAANKPPIYC